MAWTIPGDGGNQSPHGIRFRKAMVHNTEPRHNKGILRRYNAFEALLLRSKLRHTRDTDEFVVLQTTSWSTTEATLDNKLW